MKKDCREDCFGDEDICILCITADELDDGEVCPFEQSKDESNNMCTQFQCNEQNRYCPRNCVHLDRRM